MKNRMARFLVLALCLMQILLLFPLQAFARNLVDIDTKCTLTLDYGFSGVEFSIYKVGVISTTGELSLSGAFKDYEIPDNQAEWRSLSKTLEAYVRKNKPKPTDTGKTKANGRLVFRDLDVGIYLVIGKSHRKGSTTITPQVFLICLPNLYDENEDWVYDVIAKPKYGTADDGEDNGETPKKPNTPNSPNKPNNPGKLPQTGMLWWPIGVLNVCGISLFLIGFVKWKRNHEE